MSSQERKVERAFDSETESSPRCGLRVLAIVGILPEDGIQFRSGNRPHKPSNYLPSPQLRISFMLE